MIRSVPVSNPPAHLDLVANGFSFDRLEIGIDGRERCVSGAAVVPDSGRSDGLGLGGCPVVCRTFRCCGRSVLRTFECATFAVATLRCCDAAGARSRR